MVEIYVKGDVNSGGTGRDVGPTQLAKIVLNKALEVQDREYTVREEGMGDYDIRPIGGSMVTITANIHEVLLDRQFEFRPSQNARSGGSTLQGTPLQDMGGNPSKVAQAIIDHTDLRDFEFAQLNAASKGHTRLTDYEFEYEGIVQKSSIDESWATVADSLVMNN